MLARTAPCFWVVHGGNHRFFVDKQVPSIAWNALICFLTLGSKISSIWWRNRSSKTIVCSKLCTVSVTCSIVIAMFDHWWWSGRWHKSANRNDILLMLPNERTNELSKMVFYYIAHNKPVCLVLPPECVRLLPLSRCWTKQDAKIL